MLRLQDRLEQGEDAGAEAHWGEVWGKVEKKVEKSRRIEGGKEEEEAILASTGPPSGLDTPGPSSAACKYHRPLGGGTERKVT